MLDRIFDLAKIQNKITNFNDNLKKQYYNYLINEFGTLFTFHSNRIEGTNMTLTLNDTRQILNNTYNLDIKDKHKKREINETINHQNAFKYIFDILNKDLDIIEVIKNIHFIMGKDIIINAGEYKIKENYLINSNGKEINFTKPSLVSKRMEELKQKYENDWQNLTVFEKQYVLYIYSFILGGSPNSKLFKTVREKNSLCYSISATFKAIYNILYINLYYYII